MPAVLDRIDMAVMAVSGVALASWVIASETITTAGLALAAAGLNIVRLARWAGERTTAEPLVLILHVAYAFVPIGFLLLALGIMRPDVIAPTGAVHGWTIGAIGVMTLAVMTRASLGHTGRPLTATRWTELIYLAVLIAALARIAAAFDVLQTAMLHLAATAWIAAFGGFVMAYGPLLTRRRS
jgi:uncharacterized protein involved in response to NO